MAAKPVPGFSCPLERPFHPTLCSPSPPQGAGITFTAEAVTMETGSPSQAGGQAVDE